MAKIRHISSGNIFDVSKKPVYSGGVWDCGNQRFVDKTGAEYEIMITPAKVAVIEFKLLFTVAERVAINAARPINQTIDDFYELLDDSRTQNVDLSLIPVQEMLNYLVEQGLLTSDRKNQILSYAP